MANASTGREAYVNQFEIVSVAPTTIKTVQLTDHGKSFRIMNNSLTGVGASFDVGGLKNYQNNHKNVPDDEHTVSIEVRKARLKEGLCGECGLYQLRKKKRFGFGTKIIATSCPLCTQLQFEGSGGVSSGVDPTRPGLPGNAQFSKTQASNMNMLQAGRYQWNCHTVDSMERFEYHTKDGEMHLQANGTCSGSSIEQMSLGSQRTPHQYSSYIRDGTWNETSMSFVYIYGRAAYRYSVAVSHIRVNPDGRLCFILQGYWYSDKHPNEAKNRGTVKRMELIKVD